MATMYSLFLGVLFIALCSDNGDGGGVLKPDVARPSYVMSLCPDASGTVVETSKDFIETDFNNSLFSLKPRVAHTFLLDQESTQRNQGLVAHPKFNLCSLKIKNSPDLSGSNSLIFLTRSPFKFLTASQPRPFYLDTASSSLQSRLMSPVKHFAVKNDLLAYGDQGRKATNSNSVHFALGQESQSKGGIGGQETLEPACVALRSHDEHRVNSLDLCGTFYQGKVPRQSANEERIKVINIASAELGVREATGKNDGLRVEEYLCYTNLGKGYEWCAAFVSWVYGQAGFDVPRNPWSPALFPKARLIAKGKAQQADVFGIYGAKTKRINHVGLVKELSNDYLVTIEGNSNDRVESRRRHVRTIYAVANWIKSY